NNYLYTRWDIQLNQGGSSTGATEIDSSSFGVQMNYNGGNLCTASGCTGGINGVAWISMDNHGSPTACVQTGSDVGKGSCTTTYGSTYVEQVNPKASNHGVPSLEARYLLSDLGLTTGQSVNLRGISIASASLSSGTKDCVPGK